MKRSKSRRCTLVLALVLPLVAAPGRLRSSSQDQASSHVFEHFALLGEAAPGEAPARPGQVDHQADCIDGLADIYPCDRVDLAFHLPLAAIGGGSGNDIWGWTDPETGKEYALMGRSNGTSFVDISDPSSPVYLGNLPTHTGSSSWRDIKVYQNHAFVVSDLNGAHGMQVFDLTQLRSVTTPPVTFSETAHYDGFGSTHNIVINEDTGYAYSVGGDCSGGLHMVDIRDPLNPLFAGCFSADGYTHDAQCVLYHGPDIEHLGKEICFNSNEDTLTIVDVTDKADPVQISRTGYSGSSYTHQGWLTEDHAHFLLDDELDESGSGHNTRTYIWDLGDLDAPSLIGSHTGSVPAIDHNQYVHNGHLYQANYTSGLRILSLDEVGAGALTEVAYFDIYPPHDNPSFSGSWSVYPFFASGLVVVSGIGEGLFILRPGLCSAPAAPASLTATPAGDHRIDLSWTGSGAPGETYRIYRSFGACPGIGFELIAAGIAGTAYSDTEVSGQVEYSYQVTAVDETGLCESPVSNCASTSTTGSCTAPPIFSGLETLIDLGTQTCSLELGWSAATPNCGSTVSYAVYRDSVSGFMPAEDNRVEAGLLGLGWVDREVPAGETRYYVVRATDSGNGIEDANLVELGASPSGPPADGIFAAGAEVGDPAMRFTTVSAPEHLGWELSTERQHSGDRSYYSGYENGICHALQTTSLTLTAGESSTLSFWTAYDIESGYDGGVVEISADGGAIWSRLDLTPAYPGIFNGGADACGYSEGDPAFTGSDLTWTRYSADLSAFNGGEVEIRWIFSTDGSLTQEGWYVDDIEITHVQVPGPCSPEALIFADGFESGDTLAWSTVVP